MKCSQSLCLEYNQVKIRIVFRDLDNSSTLSISKMVSSIVSLSSKRLKQLSMRCILKLCVFLLHNGHNLLIIFIEDTWTKKLINNCFDGSSLTICHNLFGLSLVCILLEKCISLSIEREASHWLSSLVHIALVTILENSFLLKTVALWSYTDF